MKQEARYLTCAETAKLVRRSLKLAFPEQRFYVRSSTYSMGASIDVEWMDGPTAKQVQTITDAFEGKQFDGSIDMACHYKHWMLPDGTVTIASTRGTECSRGYIRAIENERPHPGAELVSFGSNYVSATRAHSRAFVEQVGREFSEKMGWDTPVVQEWSWWAGKKERGAQASFARDFTKSVPGSHKPLADEFNRHLWTVSAYEKPGDEVAKKPEATTAPEGHGTGFTISHERDWTWVQFGAVPSDAERAALEFVGAKFSWRREAWYIKEHIEEKVLIAALKE